MHPEDCFNPSQHLSGCSQVLNVVAVGRRPTGRRFLAAVHLQLKMATKQFYIINIVKEEFILPAS